MMLTVVRVYERGRKLSEAELRADTRCRRDLRTQTGAAVRVATLDAYVTMQGVTDGSARLLSAMSCRSGSAQKIP